MQPNALPVSIFDMTPFWQERVKERFWQFVLPEPNSGCWFWMGTAPKGYGRFEIGSRNTGTRRVLLAHRVSYEMHIGPITPGCILDHTVCRLPLCVNPRHVTPMTVSAHMAQPDSTASLKRQQTHCVNGHPFSGANLILRPNGERRCRECVNARAKAQYHKHKARRKLKR